MLKIFIFFMAIADHQFKTKVMMMIRLLPKPLVTHMQKINATNRTQVALLLRGATPAIAAVEPAL